MKLTLHYLLSILVFLMLLYSVQSEAKESIVKPITITLEGNTPFNIETEILFKYIAAKLNGREAIIEFNSKGGRLWSLDNIKSTLHRHPNIKVSISEYCYSACAFLVSELPKKQVIVKDSALLLYHLTRYVTFNNKGQIINFTIITPYNKSKRERIEARFFIQRVIKCCVKYMNRDQFQDFIYGNDIIISGKHFNNVRRMSND